MLYKALTAILVILSCILLYTTYRVVTGEPGDVRSSFGLYSDDGQSRELLERFTREREERLQPEEPPRQEPVRPMQEVARSLEVPWDIAFLPNSGFLVTERPGRVVLFDEQGNRAVIHAENVIQRGEAGLLGMVLHPNFTRNRYVYLYKTVTSGGRTVNEVNRYTFTGSSLTNKTLIVGDIPGAVYHDGGRLEFGPDRKLYIATGDASNDQLAQDITSLAGKILRVNDDGTIPEDNPFSENPFVYAYGLRNVQGMAWDTRGRMFATDHGPSASTFCCRDELNFIQKGKNYGWPEITADETREGMETPYLHSGTFTTWAPASLAFASGSLWFGGLRGAALYEVRFEEGEPVLHEHFKNEYGRIRTVRTGPDGMLYFMTSNRDGRGQPKVGDDRIFKVDPRMFRVTEQNTQ